MEAPQITLKYANDQASEISILLFLCMITEQFGFAYEIVSVSEESNNDIVIFQAYWPRKLSGQQLRFKMTDDNEQVAQMLLCDDDSAGKRSTRAKDGQKELHRRCVQFSINGNDFQLVAEPASPTATPPRHSCESAPRTSPFELNCLDLKRNQLLIQEKSQTTVDLDAKFSTKVGSALKEQNAQIEIHEVFDGRKVHSEIRNYSGGELAELLGKIFLRTAELYNNETDEDDPRE